MTAFGYFITRPLTDEEKQQLQDKLNAFGASYTEPAPYTPPAESPLPAPVGGLLNGNVPYGVVTIKWFDGVPQIAYRTDSPQDAVQVPGDFWTAVIQNAKQDQWAPFAYIALLESGYRKDAYINDALEESVGALQENIRVHTQYTRDGLSTYAAQVAAAQATYDAEGYGAWYTSSTELGLI